MRFINAGFNNYVAEDRIVTVSTPEAAPIKRIIAEAKESGRAIDLTCGKGTRAVIITDSDHVIFSSIAPKMLLGSNTERSQSGNE